MPLFMDLHKASDYDVKPTVEDIRRNHIADLEVQHKYGVKFLQYWINEDAGLVFCLMEAPDKESCAAVHREAHGAMPCNVIELKGGDYTALVDEAIRKNEFDIVENADGTMDTGYRIVMVADVLSITADEKLSDDIDQIIVRWGGKFLSRPGHRKTIVFMPGAHAVECALNIVQYVQNQRDKTEVRIAISAGEPVTDEQEIFADAIRLANRLCDLAQDGQAFVSSLAKDLIGKAPMKYRDQHKALKILNPENDQFLHQLTGTVAGLLSDASFNVDSLSEHMRMSRSQLYRKIKDLTGTSANNLVQELRMQKALQLIRNKYGNITQVAYEAGFNNLSYFAKSFQKRFGIPPLKAAKLNDQSDTE